MSSSIIIKIFSNERVYTFDFKISAGEIHRFTICGYSVIQTSEITEIIDLVVVG